MKPERLVVSLDTAVVADALGACRLSESELHAFLDALTKRYPSVMRTRRDALASCLPPSASPVPWYPLAHNVVAGERPSHSLAYAAGEFYLQDAGSLLALAATEADTDRLRGQWVCDLCASPGGKASALVEAVGESGFVLANEPIQGRLPALIYNLSRTGSDRWAVSRSDPADLADQLGDVFDMVLVDAPCSGQALLSRGKQTDAAMSAKQIDHSAQRQARILQSAMRLLKPGGKLIYSTCTFAEKENEAQVQHLIDGHGAVADPVERLAPHQSRSTPASYRLWPHLDQCAGSFAARVRKADDDSNPDTKTRAATKGSRRRPRSSGRRSDALNDWQAWFQSAQPTERTWTQAATMISWPQDAPFWVESVAVSGPEIAYRTGRTWRPSHASALRRDGLVPQQVLPVSDSMAIQFMVGQPIECALSGWAVVSWQDRPLGWVKGNGTIGKNHLPSSVRQSWAV